MHPADRVHQRHPVAGQQHLDLAKQRLVLAHAHMLEHAHRDHPVEAALDLAVVLVQEPRAAGELELGQAGIAPVHLLLGQGHAGHVDVVVPHQILGEAAPAAAHVEHAHAGLEPQLGRDMALLEPLGGLQVFAAGGVVGAGVLALAVQEEPVHLVGQVVVVGDVALRAPAVVEPVEAALEPAHVPQRALERAQPRRPEIAAEQVEEIVERGTILDRQRAVHPRTSPA